MALINNGQILGTGSTDLILNTRGKIYVKVGDRFYELDFKNEGNNRESTVINNTTINNPEQDLSPYVTKKYLKAALGEYVTKRNWEDLMQTKESLENAQLEGFTESITPITVNTMQMVVGTQNLQFDFITSLKDDTIVSPGLYINESGQLVCPRGFIKHYTLFGPQSIKPETSIEYYARWAINGDNGGDYTLLDLEEKDKPYYVYLRVNTTGYKDIIDDNVTQNLVDDPKSKNTGDWFVSTQSHAIDEEEGCAYLLVALITGSNTGGRSIGYLNGFTEILPGQITAYVFKTADGNQYLDFLNNKFRIGNNDQYIDWNGESLSIKGSLSVIGGDLKNTLEELQSSTIDIKYITNAIKKGRTDINGGLIMSGLIELGFGLADPENENYYDSFRVMSGMNGILEKNSEGIYDYTDPAIWFGGDKLDIEDENDLLKPEACILLVQENGTKYNKYLKDTTIEKPLYKWKREGQDSYYYSLTESGQPLVNSPKSDYPLQPISTQPSGNRSSFDMFLELILNNTEFKDTFGNTLSLQGNIQAYRTGQTGGNYTVHDISSNTGKTLTGSFHNYIVSSHKHPNQSNAVNLTGTEILAYLPNNSNIEGIIFTVGRVKYYIECSATLQGAKGFLYVASPVGSNPLVYVYKDQGSETFTLYGWKCGTNYVYTLDYYTEEQRHIYTLSETGVPQYTTNYTIADHYTNWAKAMFRMDGSGYLANGNISWDTYGGITMKEIFVESGNIGPLIVSSDDTGSSVKVISNGTSILDIDNKSVSINGSLTSYPGWSSSKAAINVIDPFGVQMFSVSAQPLSTDTVPIYIRRATDARLIYGKGSIMGGTVTIPENAYYPILEPHYVPSGATYKITSFELTFNIARIKSPIRGHIMALPIDSFTGKVLVNSGIDLKSWEWTGEENIGTFRGLTTTEFVNNPYWGQDRWGIYLYLEKGGQVKSGVASNSWISIYATTNNEATVVQSTEEPIPGTFIGSNGISSIFGNSTKFQWIVSSANNLNNESEDLRNQGGCFYVELPFNEDQSKQVGIRINGCKGADGTTTTPGIQISVDGTWHTIGFDNNGFLKLVN